MLMIQDHSCTPSLPMPRAMVDARSVHGGGERLSGRMSCRRLSSQRACWCRDSGRDERDERIWKMNDRKRRKSWALVASRDPGGEGREREGEGRDRRGEGGEGGGGGGGGGGEEGGGGKGCGGKARKGREARAKRINHPKKP